MDRLIGVDWGTSNLRAFRFDAAGAVADRREAPRGVLSVTGGGFEAVLADLAGDWLADGPACWLLCGMVGSRQGWLEAPYAPCPADRAALAAAVAPLSSRLGQAWIVPGVSFASAGRVDVMRGEETQILGAVDPGWRGLVVAPGTHSKWAEVEGGRIVGFRTFMTGELFAVLKAHSILGRLIESPALDLETFALGVRRSLADPAITSLLFTARAEGLLGRIPPAALESYLSGLLIGAEIAGGLAVGAADAEITLIATPQLSALYLEALALAGRERVSRIDGETAAARGLWRIGQAIEEA